MSTATTETVSGKRSIVCPFVADVEMASHLNLTSSTTELVSIGDIDKSIDITGVSLNTAFDCSGWGINTALGMSGELVSELNVKLRGDNLKNILAAAINDGQLRTYLRGEYDGAFHLAFPTYLGDVSGDNDLAESDGNHGSVTNPSQDVSGNTTLGASMVRQIATVTSYSFEIDISGAVAAQAMIAGLTNGSADTVGTARLNSLFMQLPFSHIQAAVDSAGNPKAAIGLNLPVQEGDKITFVFDINVSASTDDNTSSAANTHGDAAGTDNPSTLPTAPYTERSIQMDLGFRRVAFVLTQAAISS